MKHTIYAGVVSPFAMYLDPKAVEFDEDQVSAIEAVYAKGGAVTWDGKTLAFELDRAKAAELLEKFNMSWQDSDTMTKLRKATEARVAAGPQSLEALIATALKSTNGKKDK